jgi:predicted TIM-barrel fold metal-dependent hydrolase
MPGAGTRTVYDAGARLPDTPTWYIPYAHPALRDALREVAARVEGRAPPGSSRRRRPSDGPGRRDSQEPASRARNEERVDGTCGRLAAEGFAARLVFGSSLYGCLIAAEEDHDIRLAYGLARAHNRALLDACSGDPRLLPVGYVPLADFARAFELAVEAIATGARALLTAGTCPGRHSPSHVGLFPVWAVAQEARVPIVFHRQASGAVPRVYRRNGMPQPRGSLADADAPCFLERVTIPTSVLRSVGALLVDGVFERFPDLRVGLIGLGASWLPGWLRQLDAAHAALSATDERLRRLALRPSEYVLRQLRTTPSPGEPLAWITSAVGEHVCLFSTDHRDIPEARAALERAAAGLGARAEERFYAGNFADLVPTGTSATAGTEPAVAS